MPEQVRERPAPPERKNWALEKRDDRLAEGRARIKRKIEELSPEENDKRGRLQKALLRFDNELNRMSKPELGKKEHQNG